MVNNPKELSGMEPQLGSSHSEDVDGQSFEYAPQLGGIHGQRIRDEFLSKYKYRMGGMSPEEFRRLHETRWIHGQDENCGVCDSHSYSQIIDSPSMFLTSDPHPPERIAIIPTTRVNEYGTPIAFEVIDSYTATIDGRLVTIEDIVNRNVSPPIASISVNYSASEALREVEENIRREISESSIMDDMVFTPSGASLDGHFMRSEEFFRRTPREPETNHDGLRLESLKNWLLSFIRNDEQRYFDNLHTRTTNDGQEDENDR